MPDDKEVSVKLTAVDVTGKAYESAGKRLEEFIHKNHKAAHEIAEAAKGFAAAEIADKLGEVFSKVGELSEKFAEQYEKAATGVDRGQAFHDLARSAAEAIPGIGGLVHGIKAMDDGLGNAYAAWAKAHGASEEAVDAMRSDEAMIKHYTETLEKQGEAIEFVTQGRRALTLEALAATRGGTGGDARRTASIEAQEAEDRHNENVKKNRDALEKLQKEAGDNPDDRQKQMLAAYRQTDLMERSRYGQEKVRLATEASRAIQEAMVEEAARVNETDAHGREARDELAAAQRDHDRLQEQERFESGQKILDIQTEADAARARAEYRDGDASLIEIRRQYDKEIAESVNAEKRKIDEIEEAKIKKQQTNAHVDEAEVESDKQAVAGRAAEERRAANVRFLATEHAAKVAAANTTQDESEQRRHTFASMRLEIMKEEAAMGNQAAKTAAEQLGIEEKYTEKRAELNRLLREGHNLSEAEKKQIQDTIKANDVLQQAEIAKMKMGVMGAPTSPFSQQSEMGAGDTGMRETFAAGVRSADDRKLELMQKMVDGILAQNAAAADTNAKLGDIVNNVVVR